MGAILSAGESRSIRLSTEGPARPPRPQPDGETVVAAAFERQGQGFGRVWMRLLLSASSSELTGFIFSAI
jgi:hypothetical protein